MKLAIFGATGSVGTHLVQQAIEAGHEVTAFVRSPSKLHIQSGRLRVVRGDVLSDHDRIAEAVSGQDAVMITLGAGAKGRIRSLGTQNIITAMEACGVDRLICQSTLGAGDSVKNLNFKWWLLFRVPLRLAMADHEAQETLVRKSKLDWTIVRPSAFTDGPKTERYQHGFPSNERKLLLSVSRADVAHFMLKELSDSRYRHQEVSISC